MGNATSQHASNTQYHFRLGQVSLSNSTDEHGNLIEQMNIVRMVESQTQFNKWHKQVSKIDDSVTRQVLLLPNKTVYQSTGFCGSNGVLKLSYDYYPYVFQVEIENRRKINRFFLQTELWYLLYNMIRAGSKFEKYHSKIGDIHPQNILINTDGLIKLISTCSFPHQQTNFDKILQNSHAKVFLAPQQLEQHSIQRAEYPKNINPSIAECYSIGLCMLTAGTLQDVSSIYAWEQGEKKVQKQKVNYYLKLFGDKYSSFLHSLVIGLLAYDTSQRKKCSEIYSTLYEYEQKILDLQSFLPNNSRLIPFPQQMPINSGQPLQINDHNRPIYNERPQTLHSRANSTNIYYNPNGFVVNPIESKYVSVSPLNSYPLQGFRQNTYVPVIDTVQSKVYPQNLQMPTPYNGYK